VTGNTIHHTTISRGDRSLGVPFSYSPCILILVITAFSFHISTLF